MLQHRLRRWRWGFLALAGMSASGRQRPVHELSGREVELAEKALREETGNVPLFSRP